jgi:hypothetical protein
MGSSLRASQGSARIPTVKCSPQKRKKNGQPNKQSDIAYRRILHGSLEPICQHDDSEYARAHSCNGAQEKIADPDLDRPGDEIDDGERRDGDDSSEQHGNETMT